MRLGLSEICGIRKKTNQMNLNRSTLAEIKTAGISMPGDAYLELPEKVLQFGTGVLLRGLPDFFIDKANKQQLFNGRIVVVKSTATPGADAFDTQNGLFTHCIRGIFNGQLRDDYIVNASISRVLTAATQWEQIVALAANPEMEIIISNTTEAGLVLNKEDKAENGVPASFPGKLMAFLYRRWKHFEGAASAGMVILPTELVPDNGILLAGLVEELAKINQLEDAFIQWLRSANQFCNTLVDRIVPGKLSPELQEHASQHLGYSDELMIMSEPFSLWAIESASEQVIKKLSFVQADQGVVIAPSIKKFRELKLRLLNGTHTFSCALAFLTGFETVKQAMSSPSFVAYLNDLMRTEIVPGILGDDITEKDAMHFADSVLERFANPYIEHRWISITLNFTEKMRMRNIPLLLKYYQLKNQVPKQMALGFATYLLFMHSAVAKGNEYFGSYDGKTYKIDDIKAAVFAKNAGGSLEDYVHAILKETDLWQTDLTQLESFESSIVKYIKQINQEGVSALLDACNSI